ncbi:MAG: riboflavin synthase [Vallitalea sp.]|jgi:riboflavin synthase|nr:riboflavin synthase [Vallitalea sp.]
MFTGLVSEIGKIISINKGTQSAKLTIRAMKVLQEVSIGDSISVNGICLTVTSYTKDCFTVDVMPETFRMTNLQKLQVNSEVNLEPALKVSDRLGGHIVTGHIDGTGIISKYVREENATRITIDVEDSLHKYIIHKGSVALDGISLTVASVMKNSFQVSIIPLTAKDTTLLRKKVGDKINIECDIVGKYVEKLLMNRQEEKTSKIDTNFLKQNGFI